MDAALQGYREGMEKHVKICTETGELLQLEYDLSCLADQKCTQTILEMLAGKECIDTEAPPEHAMEVEMAVNLGRLLNIDGRQRLLSNIEQIQGINMQMARCKDELIGKYGYLHRLLGEDLFLRFAMDVESISSLVRASPSEMTRYGVKKQGFPLLGEHPLVLMASPENQEKMLRKLCCKVLIAVKLDIAESSFEIDLYCQMEDILGRLEAGKRKADAPLPVPRARKTTRRGGIKAKRRRQDVESPRKRQFVKFEPGDAND